MTPEDFSFLARLLRRRSGLAITCDRMDLAERRLTPVLGLFNLKDMQGLLRQLRLGDEPLAEAVTEAMAVNEFSFFRDADLFARFQHDVLPPLLIARQRARRLRIWSAAAAAGQEAYSIAMILSDLGLAARGWTVEIIATDLSAQALARAGAGLYNEDEIGRDLPLALRDAWFEAEAGQWRVHESLRRMVRFRRFNLLDSFGWLDDIDIVFCRNVLMYLDGMTRASLLERLADVMAEDGILLLGQAESALPHFAVAHGGNGLYARKRPARIRLAG